MLLCLVVVKLEHYWERNRMLLESPSSFRKNITIIPSNVNGSTEKSRWSNSRLKVNNS